MPTILIMTGSTFYADGTQINNFGIEYEIQGSLSTSSPSSQPCSFLIENAQAQTINITGSIGSHCSVTFNNVQIRKGSLSLIGEIGSENVSFNFTKLDAYSDTIYPSFFFQPVLEQQGTAPPSSTNSTFLMQNSNISRSYDQSKPGIFSSPTAIPCSNNSKGFTSVCIAPIGSEIKLINNNFSNFGMFQQTAGCVVIAGIFPTNSVDNVHVKGNTFTGVPAAYSVTNKYYTGLQQLKLFSFQMKHLEVAENNFSTSTAESGMSVTMDSMNMTEQIVIRDNNFTHMSSATAQGSKNLVAYAILYESSNFSANLDPTKKIFTIADNRFVMQSKNVYAIRTSFKTNFVDHLEIFRNTYNYNGTQDVSNVQFVNGIPGGQKIGTFIHNNTWSGHFISACYMINLFEFTDALREPTRMFSVENNVQLFDIAWSRATAGWQYTILFQDLASGRQSIIDNFVARGNTINTTGGHSWSVFVAGNWKQFGNITIENNTVRSIQNFPPASSLYTRDAVFYTVTARVVGDVSIQNNYMFAHQDYANSVWAFFWPKVESAEPWGAYSSFSGNSTIVRNNILVLNGTGQHCTFARIQSTHFYGKYVTIENNQMIMGDFFAISLGQFSKSYFVAVQDANNGITPLQFNSLSMSIKNNSHVCSFDKNCNFAFLSTNLDINGEVIVENNSWISLNGNSTGNKNFVEISGNVNANSLASANLGWNLTDDKNNTNYNNMRNHSLKIIRNYAQAVGWNVRFVLISSVNVFALNFFEVSENEFVGTRNDTFLLVGTASGRFSSEIGQQALINSSLAFVVRVVLSTTIFGNKVTVYGGRNFVGFATLGSNWTSDYFNFSRNSFKFYDVPVNSLAHNNNNNINNNNPLAFFKQASETSVNSVYFYFSKCKNGCYLIDNYVEIGLRLVSSTSSSSSNNVVEYSSMFSLGGKLSGEFVVRNNSRNVSTCDSSTNSSTRSYVVFEDADLRLNMGINNNNNNSTTSPSFVVENSSLYLLPSTNQQLYSEANFVSFTNSRKIVILNSASTVIIRNNKISATSSVAFNKTSILNFNDGSTVLGDGITCQDSSSSSSASSSFLLLENNMIQNIRVSGTSSVVYQGTSNAFTFCSNSNNKNAIINLVNNSLVNANISTTSKITLYDQRSTMQMKTATATSNNNNLLLMKSNSILINDLPATSSTMLQMSLHSSTGIVIQSSSSSSQQQQIWKVSFENNTIDFSPSAIRTASNDFFISSSFLMPSLNFSNISANSSSEFSYFYSHSAISLLGNTISTIRSSTLPDISSLDEKSILDFKMNFVLGSNTNNNNNNSLQLISNTTLNNMRNSNKDISFSIGPVCNQIQIYSNNNNNNNQTATPQPSSSFRAQKAMFLSALPGVGHIYSPICDTSTKSLSMRTLSESNSGNKSSATTSPTEEQSETSSASVDPTVTASGTYSESSSKTHKETRTKTISLIHENFDVGLTVKEKEKQEQTTQVTNSVAAAFAAPTAALTAARGLAVFNLIGCPKYRNPADKLTWIESPMGFPQSLFPHVGLGDAQGQYARAAVLGFVSVLLLVCGISIAVGFLLEIKKRKDFKVRLEQLDTESRLMNNSNNSNSAHHQHFQRRGSNLSSRRRSLRSNEDDDEEPTQLLEMDEFFLPPSLIPIKNSQNQNSNKRNSPHSHQNQRTPPSVPTSPTSKKSTSTSPSGSLTRYPSQVLSSSASSTVAPEEGDDLEMQLLEERNERPLWKGALENAPYPALIAIVLSQILPFWSVSGGMLMGTLQPADVILGLGPLLILAVCGFLLSISVDKILFNKHGPRVAKSLIYRPKESGECSKKISDFLLTKVMRILLIGFYCWAAPRTKHVSEAELDELEKEHKREEKRKAKKLLASNNNNLINTNQDDHDDVSEDQNDSDTDFEDYFNPSAQRGSADRIAAHREKQKRRRENYEDIMAQRQASADLIPRMRKVLQKYWGPLTQNELAQLEREARLDLRLKSPRHGASSYDESSTSPRANQLQRTLCDMKKNNSINNNNKRRGSLSPTSSFNGLRRGSRDNNNNNNQKSPREKSIAEQQLEEEEQEIQNSCVLRTIYSTSGLWNVRARVSPHFLFISSVISMAVGLAQGFALAGPDRYCQNSIRVIAAFNCLAAVVTIILRPNIVPFSNFVAIVVEICMAIASFIAAVWVAEGLGGKDLAAQVQLLCAQSAIVGGGIELAIAVVRFVLLVPFKLEIVPRVEVFRRAREDMDQVSILLGSAFSLAMVGEVLGL